MYYIATRQLSGLPAAEVASIAARTIRSMQKNAKTAQFPLVSGGEGTTEQLVTATLGSFLEVEVTGADGEQMIVPIGFAGDGGTIGIIEMRQVAPELSERKATKKKRQFTGTTFGVGELIQDVLDEGAFSVILGWEEPLAGDAGFGLAQALGFKFLDAQGKPLDFRTDTPISEIKSIDVSERPFNILSSKFYAARSEAVPSTKQRGQITVEDAVMEEELSRVAELLQRDCGITVPVSAIKSGGSYIEFGLAAFLNAEVRDGSLLALEVTNFRKSLEEAKGELIVVAQKLEDITSDRATPVMKEIMKMAEETSTVFHVVTLEAPKQASETRYRTKYPLLRQVVSLESAMFAPIDPSLRANEIRRQLTYRFERGFTALVEPQVASTSDATAIVQ